MTAPTRRSADDPTPRPVGADIDDFARLDIRVGVVRAARPLADARRPALALDIDLGPELGVRQSSAQITDRYDPADLPGRRVLCVVNLPTRRVAGFDSEVLTLGVYAGSASATDPDAPAGLVVLIAPDDDPALRPGDRLG